MFKKYNIPSFSSTSLPEIGKIGILKKTNMQVANKKSFDFYTAYKIYRFVKIPHDVTKENIQSNERKIANNKVQAKLKKL